MTSLEERHRQDQIVVRALNAHCVDCQSVFDFVNGATPLAAVPVLISLLDQIDEPMICEGIVRALTTKAAKHLAEEPLLELFVRLPSDGTVDSLKWAIGNALSVLDRNRHSDALISIARDRRHGSSRQMVISALGFVKNPQATPTLIELLDDEQVNGHVIGALRARRVVAAIPLLARFEEHPNAWIRRSARNAIAALTKRARAVTIH